MRQSDVGGRVEPSIAGVDPGVAVSPSQVAIVTGAGSGIGRATAMALAEAGMIVMVAGRRESALEETSAAIRAAMHEARVELRPTDVGDADECEALVAETIERLGRVDATITAAAGFEPAHICDMTADTWDACMDVVLRGSVLVAAAAARHMRDHGGGRIVLVSSINGAESEPDTANYSAAKAAIISVARSMAVDLAGNSIAVNAVAPGWVDTPMIAEFVETATEADLKRLNPLARLGRPDEIAGFIAYLATAAPLFLTGTTVFVDGGQTAMAPIPRDSLT